MWVVSLFSYVKSHNLYQNHIILYYHCLYEGPCWFHIWSENCNWKSGLVPSPGGMWITKQKQYVDTSLNMFLKSTVNLSPF